MQLIIINYMINNLSNIMSFSDNIVDELSEKLLKLNINASDKEIDMLADLFKKVNINTTEVIESLENISVNDDKVTIQLKNRVIILHIYGGCRSAYEQSLLTPRWQDSC